MILDIIALAISRVTSHLKLSLLSSSFAIIAPQYTNRVSNFAAINLAVVPKSSWSSISMLSVVIDPLVISRVPLNRLRLLVSIFNWNY